ncbi:MAG: hypothetical protein JWO63_707 [Frankiales bacterium]|jgi:hypothetical protein|nr:hypothetical protein [Frankiales bacterium]
MKGNEVDCMLLRIEGQGGDRLAPALRAAGAESVQDVQCAPTAAELDRALAMLGARRLVVAASVGGLQLALGRLMRRGELDSVETALLSPAPPSYLRTLGLPAGEPAQVQLAVSGAARLVGVLKDDSGGLCLDTAELRPWPGAQSKWWLRAVVDDQPLCDGPAEALTVRRLGPAELEASVRFGRWRRRTVRGRSLQLACDEALISQDGLDRPRPRTKRTLWSEPKLWNLCLE